ncbi:LOW QUALITY PROTEIN: PRP38 family-domain-containing protein [Jimgerdemannia flammicorona]|uniref:Pre-mRNA-splicing factor 38 n=1 Tax=Jimgerdemannia flammicorona TaxID=994334 RepID=A0A433QAP8_9FUNG|nr:LOW QUALITY PROTEIN: PRP38 family-domain-containing protein [Jimgerdemannia flammicorona]
MQSAFTARIHNTWSKKLSAQEYMTRSTGRNPASVSQVTTRSPRSALSLQILILLSNLPAATVLDKAIELNCVGGQYGPGKPTEFMCLTLKLLQLQPDKQIVIEYIRNEDFKYLRALGAFYLRLVGTTMEVYQYLEPLLNDYRKLRRKSEGKHLYGYSFSLCPCFNHLLQKLTIQRARHFIGTTSIERPDSRRGHRPHGRVHRPASTRRARLRHNPTEDYEAVRARRRGRAAAEGNGRAAGRRAKTAGVAAGRGRGARLLDRGRGHGQGPGPGRGRYQGGGGLGPGRGRGRGRHQGGGRLDPGQGRGVMTATHGAHAAARETAIAAAGTGRRRPPEARDDGSTTVVTVAEAEAGAQLAVGVGIESRRYRGKGGIGAGAAIVGKGGLEWHYGRCGDVYIKGRCCLLVFWLEE